MAVTENIDIEKYMYTLPVSAIAKYPLAGRDQSKLLFYNQGKLGHHPFRKLPHILPLLQPNPQSARCANPASEAVFPPDNQSQ